MSGTAERLMDLAERRMREAGYHGFSFRDLAAEIGIKSASVHHHFPTKAEMVIAIVHRHNERFAELVTPKAGETPADVVRAYRNAFRRSLTEKGGMCLNGLFGAESGGLPSELLTQVEQFFASAASDLARRIGGPDAEARAFAILALLEGALILARVHGDIDAFDKATADLVAAEVDQRSQRVAA